MIIAVDFDGTLCENDYPHIGLPHEYMIDYIKRMKAKDCIIILWTCRCGKKLREAIKWCKGKGITFDYVNQNTKDMRKRFGSNPSRKINADIYIDDKNRTVQDIMNYMNGEK